MGISLATTCVELAEPAYSSPLIGLRACFAPRGAGLDGLMLLHAKLSI